MKLLIHKTLRYISLLKKVWKRASESKGLKKPFSECYLNFFDRIWPHCMSNLSYGVKIGFLIWPHSQKIIYNNRTIEMRAFKFSLVINIVVGRKINYSVPDDWYFPISDHIYVTESIFLFSRWLVLINTSHLENSVLFSYSPDDWYWGNAMSLVRAHP